MNIERLKYADKDEQIKAMIQQIDGMEGQIIKQEKMASIGCLAAGVAHEINNPLGFIASNFESLRKYMTVLKNLMDEYLVLENLILEKDYESADSKVKNIMEHRESGNVDFIYEDMDMLISECNEGMDRIKAIVKSLRVFSYESSQDKFESYDMNEAINNTLIIARNEIKYSAEVKLELANIPFIEAIPGHINQVLLNVTINAAQAIKEKYEGKLGLIRISTYSDDSFVYCDIEDNGIGMEKEIMSKIFNSFFTTKPSGKGTGLGLAISYDLIKNKHKGDIIFTSEKGKGTKFTIKLPIKQ